MPDTSADTVATTFYSQWISRFGSPITITTDQGTKFESQLFEALTKLVGAKRIRTTAYHPASNGMIKRWHRSLKTAIMCHEEKDWVGILPTVLLGLRTSLKEDIKASAAELVYGENIRLPGEFFLSEELLQDPHIPIPTAHHTKKKHFIQDRLYTCTHIFLRVDAVKKTIRSALRRSIRNYTKNYR
ncbi:PREDICTED: uncharacterized protein LOC107073544 [Polistes dominula]|uniref:Uncharacterized protein LOC107073544 n=1 Tax=Polistes dominula TaxID=743375 RepID=A0ABM1JB77_POLDO|nr:PREDICTED: uncharacterized protein LOC107073544 [Polistes dominula]